MDVHALMLANKTGTLDRDGAIELAWRLASRWGGKFEVYEPTEHSGSTAHRVIGSSGSHDASKAGERLLGSAMSFQIGELRWAWADDAARPTPPSPFDKMERPGPAQLVGHLDVEARLLHDTVLLVKKVQSTFSNSTFFEAYKSIQGGVVESSLDRPVSNSQYIALIVNRGLVQQETERLNRLLEATRQAMEAKGANHPAIMFRAADILFGRVPVPPAEDPPAAGPRF